MCTPTIATRTGTTLAHDFPIAYEEYRRELSLPIYSAMTDEDVTDVIEAVSDVVQTFGR